MTKKVIIILNILGFILTLITLIKEPNLLNKVSTILNFINLIANL